VFVETARSPVDWPAGLSLRSRGSSGSARQIGDGKLFSLRSPGPAAMQLDPRYRHPDLFATERRLYLLQPIILAQQSVHRFITEVADVQTNTAEPASVIQFFG